MYQIVLILYVFVFKGCFSSIYNQSKKKLQEHRTELNFVVKFTRKTNMLVFYCNLIYCNLYFIVT